MVLRRDAVHGGAGLRIEIPVNDHVVLDAFENSCDRENRQREPAVLRLDGFRMEQENHRSRNLPASITNRDGGR